LMSLARQFQVPRNSAVNAFLEFARRWEEYPLTESGSPIEFVEYLEYFREARGTVPLAMTEEENSVKLMTVHGAKGLEYEHVFVLRAIKPSFPAGYRESLIDFPRELTNSTSFSTFDDKTLCEHEERRLFYVALTRTRRRCFVLTDAEKRSVFIDELDQPEYGRWVIPTTSPARGSAPCPKCRGRLLPHTGRYGRFWRCTNYPCCDGRLPTCKSCGEGVLVRRGDDVACTSAPECANTAPACLRCDMGTLVLRQAQKGQFFGCSRWPDCSYTRPIAS